MKPNDPSWDHDILLSEFIGCFAARDDLYVINGAEVRRESLTPDVLRHAVSHNYALSGYTAQADGRTHIGAIDFDTDEGLDQAFKVQALLEAHDIPSMVSESRRGAHVWVTAWDWCEAGLTYRALRSAMVLALGDESAMDSKIEVFPKPGTDLAVGALRMPGLAHQRTAQVYPVHMLGVTYQNPTFLAILNHHVLTDRDALKRLAGSATPKALYPKNLSGWEQTSHGDFGEAPSASAVLQKWGINNARPGGTVRCPMHDDKRQSLTVFKDDARVYCGSPGCRLNNDGHGIGSLLLSRME